MSRLPERRYPRVDFHDLPLVFALRLPEPASPERPLRIEARNLSRGGIKFLCNRRFALFEPMQISFFDKTSGKPVPNLEAKVVRVEEIDTGFGERTYGIAMEFTAGTEGLAPFLPEGAEKASAK